MDINEAFFNLPLYERYQKYTAFVTSKGQWKWTRLPMGISIASQCFTRAMNQVFSDILYRELVIYVDDLCSFGPNFEAALERLETVFKRIEESGLKINRPSVVFSMRR